MQVSSARVDAEAQVARAQVQDEAAELALKRAAQLVTDRLAGTKLLDEAKAQRETARATLRAALSQRESMLGTGAKSGPLSLVGVEAPMAGVLREVRVAVHQQVVAGTPLFEVVSDENLWVRVPVPSGQWSALLADGDDPSRALALVDSLSAPAESVPVPATPVQPMPLTPPSPQGTAMGMLDRYFALSDSRRFVLGESPSVVVPAAALLRDPGGAAWVYERSAPQVFFRRRVEVIRIDSGLAMVGPRSLSPTGLHLGSSVVTAGAMELYGAEFGAGK
jgi:multidrug efflux pump subunit AcrA (membrane-fusion protein)